MPYSSFSECILPNGFNISWHALCATLWSDVKEGPKVFLKVNTSSREVILLVAVGISFSNTSLTIILLERSTLSLVSMSNVEMKFLTLLILLE